MVELEVGDEPLPAHRGDQNQAHIVRVFGLQNCPRYFLDVSSTKILGTTSLPTILGWPGYWPGYDPQQYVGWCQPQSCRRGVQQSLEPTPFGGVCCPVPKRGLNSTYVTAIKCLMETMPKFGLPKFWAVVDGEPKAWEKQSRWYKASAGCAFLLASLLGEYFWNTLRFRFQSLGVLSPKVGLLMCAVQVRPIHSDSDRGRYSLQVRSLQISRQWLLFWHRISRVEIPNTTGGK